MGRTIYTINVRNDGLDANPPNFFTADSPYGRLAVYFDEPGWRGTAHIGLYVSHDDRRLKVASVQQEEKKWINSYFMKGYDNWITIDWEQTEDTATKEEFLDRYVLAMICAACSGAPADYVTLFTLRKRTGNSISHEALAASLSRLYESGKVDDEYTNSHRIYPLSEPEGTEGQAREEYLRFLLLQRNPASNPVYRAILNLWAAGGTPSAGTILEESGEMTPTHVKSGIVTLKNLGMIANVSEDPKNAVYAPLKALIVPKERRSVTRKGHHNKQRI